MRIVAVAIVVMLTCAAAGAESDQRRRATARKPPAPPPLKIEPLQPRCPETLGTGVKTGASYCFVLAGRQPADGILIPIPPHVGPATLLFDLHNRHTYSDEDIRAGHGFAKYTAVIAALLMDGTLIGRGAVQSEFRTARDLYDRVAGGAGGGAKAVAPLGREEVRIAVPATADQVSLLGEVLDATTAAGHETATPGRTVAIVSNVRLEYRPAPPKPPAKVPAKRR